MRILIDIGHPGHVHLFKYFALEMQKRGNEILFTCREKEFEIELLKYYNFNFISFGKKFTSNIGKFLGLAKFDIKEFISGLKFKPDVFLSHGSMYAAHAAFFLRKPHIALEDTGNMEQIKLYRPFSSVILTPDSLNMDFGKKQIEYAGYHELAYLKPNYFTPDSSVFKELGITNNEKFIVVRFVSWKASHDIGQFGISMEMKLQVIKVLSKSVKVFISSEEDLPNELKKYQLKIAPEKMHTVLAYATLFIGEGATMANESAILGTPAIYINSRKACIGDLEEYNLLFHLESNSELMNKIYEIIKYPNAIEEWQKQRAQMLKDKIDVTAFLVWFVENYPNSKKIMKENPDYQYNFK